MTRTLLQLFLPNLWGCISARGMTDFFVMYGGKN